jgi:flagellar motor switch protein FliN/FliY
MMSEEDGLNDWADAMEEQADDKGKTDVEFGTDAEVAGLEEFDEDHEITSQEKRKLDTILDIPVTIAMEVGRTNISIRNLLQLNQGSVVELDRVAGEPLDVLVNGTLIAHGEVVVVNDKFGIRLTDVISQLERIKKIR